MVEKGLNLSGISPDGRIVEMIEFKSHPWFIATQAHPEFKSPSQPSPSAVPRIRGRASPGIQRSPLISPYPPCPGLFSGPGHFVWYFTCFLFYHFPLAFFIFSAIIQLVL